MRLHSLELTAIGPYATPQRIDFERLAGSGLFLLEGPTGAGKTTILDAITFALYGGLSGDGAGRDRLHSDFAGPGVEPSVTLEFSVRGQRYLIHRVPEYQRLKKRGDGFTLQATRVHLQRLEGGRWVSQSSGKDEVGELITDAIGLSRAQFTQVMLLPQGEFAKFLASSDDKRRELLTKLFGTELYDRITAELEQRSRAATGARREAAVQIGTAAAAAAEAAGLDAAAREELLGLSRADRATRLKELDAGLATAIELNEQARGVAAERLAAARGAADRETRQAELTARLAGALERLAAHEATRPEHAGRVERLAAARRAEPVRPLLAGLEEARAVRAAVAGPAVVDGCDTAEQAVAGAEQAVAGAELAERAAAELEHLARQEAALPERETELAGLGDAATAAADLAGRLELARQQLPERIETVTARLGEARLAEAGLADALSQRAVAAGQLDAASRAAELAEQHAGLDAAARAAIDTHQELVGAYQQAMAARLENMAAELADRLSAGEACPVCGSTEHPEPAESLEDAVSAQDVAAAGERQEAAAAEREQAEAVRDTLAAELASAVTAAGGVPAADLEAELAVLDERVGQAEQGAADADGLAAELTDLTAERAKLDEEVKQAAAADAAAQSQAAHAAAELDRLRADLTAAAQPYPSVGARQTALRQAAASGRALAEALTRLAAAVAAEQQATERAEQELRAGGFASLAEASAAVLPVAEQARLDDEVSAWTTSLAGLLAGTQAPELAGLDPARGPEAEARARAATAELETATAAEREVSEVGQALAGQDRRLRQRLAELEAAEAAADRLAEQTDPVLRLSGLARGMDGQRRITLTTYVLRRWFEQVVAAANVRLAAMSAGRYELTRSEDPEKKNQRTGPTLAVIDRHTGEERSPRSLSGGETFYTSLALALGLADVVRAEAGGVELDTLFIDEGFGSLDAETLDQVMSVIDDLRDRGRVVGIVSHVADLKDRVYERLEVRRRPDGSSAATVVA